MEITCYRCGTVNPDYYLSCRKCKADLTKPSEPQSENNLDNQQISIATPILELEGEGMATALRVISVIYGILCFFGALLLFHESKQVNYIQADSLFSMSETETIYNNTFIAIGVGSVISSIIIILICFGIARIIDQNIQLAKWRSDIN